MRQVTPFALQCANGISPAFCHYLRDDRMAEQTGGERDSRESSPVCLPRGDDLQQGFVWGG